MILVHPEALFLLVLVVLILFLKKSKKLVLLEHVFSKEILEKLEVKSSKYINKNIKFFLAILALVCMIVALSRPILLDKSEGQEVSYQSFDIAVVLDISKSMEAKDVFPDRLSFAKKSLDKIMSNMREANVAVIAFANDAFLVNPFSNDFDSIKFLLSNLNANSLSSKGSQIISALKATSKIYESTDDKKKIVLLISDGADGQDIDEISKYVKNNDIVLHVLSIGTKKGTSLSDGEGGYIKDKNGNIVISKRDDKVLDIAKSSGGAYLSLSGDMSKIDWLANQIKATAQKKEIKKDKYAGAKELFYYPLAIALFLIFFVLNSPRIPFLVFLLFINTNAKAGLFDFWDTYKANESYKAKEYEKAGNYFSKIDKDEAIYNKANALYKQKKYKEALKAYESIESFEGDKELKRLYDVGNSYAKLKKIDEAIKSYEEALKIKDDEDTKYNLDLLKKQKKQQKKQQNKDKNKKNKQKDKNKQNKDKSKKNKDEKNKNSKNKKDKDQDKNKKETDKKNSKEKKQDEAKKNGTKQKNSQTNQKKDKKISETEAKKWEKKMKNREFTTKPVKLQKAQGSNKNEISW